ncbi:FAD:protein FMN transferase [Clostridium beijerinckii]|uniref:FAD:protein FMN transferase n=1 Tax=Clostridium beijerinckii TaxID=1520 RepID=A0A9Q5CQ57_CLOBE|nr:FAD:protein FMN transferase [Clostridium beijerinckii]AQS06336.1 thiamine biosynthesis lipoprotein ApbE precursor [Clostridium beijerinckii]MBA2885706.1 thiamine biosynthesis lipoprotein [Clostridium beijerinckii]MBA2900593.1 thiamine biosynthesis lipoprotein [Clostridium beijerinckii]MBA2910265.1 thiamine biosynthesis lipoprotein [Clostridium beijerinckii]MBA9014051.1 thiamine biosynthesis lipoprotein [Clostridium beijerinckii]
MDRFYEMESFCMGTIISQKVYGENAKVAAIEVEYEMKRLEGLMSFFLESSEVSKLNRAAGQYEVELSDEVLFVLNKAKHYSEICKGSFDITLTPLARLWGIFTSSEKIPLQEEINEALKLTGHNYLSINNELKTSKLEKSGQCVDLGAIAKGYAADRAIEIYKQYGVESAFVNLGGNVAVLGNKPNGDPFRVGIQNPLLQRGQCLGAVNAANKTVVTSGDYVRYFEKDNKKYHHILDPRTGYPAESSLMSTTIVSKESIAADALSTAIFILGLEDGIKLIDSQEDMEAIFITKDKEIYVTKGLKEDFTFFKTDGFTLV